MTTAAVNAEAQNVAWDTTHGTYLSYTAAGNFSSLAGQLTTAGFTVTDVTGGIDNANLSNVQVVVVSVTNSWNSAYTASEVTALKNFVRGGGGLLILCDEVNIAANANVAPVATAFGVTCGADASSNSTTVWANHPIAAGVSTVTHGAAGALTAAAPASIVGRDAGGRNLVAVARSGCGNVVVVGDINWAINGPFSTANNALFAQNVFNWLAIDYAVAVAASTESPGASCTHGGMRLDLYCDINSNAAMEANEMKSTSYVCNGAPGIHTLVGVTDEPAGTNCPTGGKRIDSGIDTNNDGNLDAGEITATSYVCNGATGRDALISSTDEPAGANCTNGGKRLDSGIDENRNGVLDAAEIDSTDYVCNGTDADALVSTHHEAAGANCKAGGTRIDVGLDSDGDGSLAAAEITSTSYVCNGENDGGCSATGGRSAPSILLVLLGATLLVRKRRR